MKITIIGSGQVGLTWAQALTGSETCDVSLSDPYPPAAATQWAMEVGLSIHPNISEWITSYHLILVCVPGSVLPGVARSLAQHAKPGSIIVDMTTAAAQAKRDGASLATAAGIEYVDIAITGAVALSGVRTPLLYGGARLGVVEELFAAVGAPVRVLPDSQPGDAVTVKLLRSVIMKGLEALALEALPAARAYGVLDQLYAVLSDVDQAPFADLLNSMVATHPAHAARRHAEVLEAAAQLDAVGHPSELTQRVAEKYASTVENTRLLGAPSGPTAEASLNWLDRVAKHHSSQNLTETEVPA